MSSPRAESGGQRQSEGQRLALELDLPTAKKMAELAQAEGLAYGSIQKRNVSGLDLEHQFSLLSQHVVGKDLFWGRASLFNWAFDLGERRLLFYLLSLMNRAWARRKRRAIARGIAGRSAERSSHWNVVGASTEPGQTEEPGSRQSGEVALGCGLGDPEVGGKVGPAD